MRTCMLVTAVLMTNAANASEPYLEEFVTYYGDAKIKVTVEIEESVSSIEKPGKECACVDCECCEACKSRETCKCPECGCCFSCSGKIAPKSFEVDKDFEKKWKSEIVGAGHELVLITADWCGYCPQAKEKLESIKFVVYLMDADKEKKKAKEWAGDGGLPSLIYLNDGKFVKRVSGTAINLAHAKKWLEDFDPREPNVSATSPTKSIRVIKTVPATRVYQSCSGGTCRTYSAPTWTFSKSYTSGCANGRCR